MGCCECHDHKFDPFTTRDFYRMEAFFADIEERGLYSGANVDGNWGPSIRLPSADQSAELARIDGKIAAVKQKLAASTPELETAQVEWERSRRAANRVDAHSPSRGRLRGRGHAGRAR